MTEEKKIKGSVNKPWLQYYPEFMKNIVMPECTILEYLKMHCKGEELTAIQFYGTEITWKEFFDKVELVARAMKAIGLKEGDQFPSFLPSTPEFLYVLLAAEKIGVSVLCRDNTLEENIEAVSKSEAKLMIAPDFLAQADLERYLKESSIEKVILVDACNSCNREDLPEHNAHVLNACYPEVKAHGDATIVWEAFLALANDYEGEVDATRDLDRPLFRAYTSGSTGTSKQVIHSSLTMLAVVHQTNFYSASEEFRPVWMMSLLPPALIAAVVSMMLLPLATNNILALSPYAVPEDLDLELMHYRPNFWAIVPMFMEIIMASKRIPKDYDMSHLFAAGTGAEAFNNNQADRAEAYLRAHNCNVTFTTGYGCSESGSNLTLPLAPYPIRNGNIGVPLPLTTMGIFKPGTQEELGANEVGEICASGPGMMLGYDNIEATKQSIQTHDDGSVWLHIGDTGYMNEDGVFYSMTRGVAPRFGGGDLAVLPMENLLADAKIKGIVDEFFVVIPDKEHDGFFVPYLYIVLEEGYTVAQIENEVREILEDYMQPVEIFAIEERPFFHFKTARVVLAKELQER